MAEIERKESAGDGEDSGRTVVNPAAANNAALGAHAASTTGGDGFDEKGLPGDTGDPEAEQHELSRRERERLMRRQLMLDAARAVFAEKGFAAATLDEVAARAEFGKGTLYNYFEGGKEEILYAIFDDLYDALSRLIDATLSPELVESSPFREVFEGFLTAIFAFFLDRQDQFMILMKEGHRMMFNEEPEKAHYFKQQGERIIDVMIRGIEAAQAKGELRDLPSQSIAHMIMGNVKGYHMHRCVEHHDEYAAPSPETSAQFLTTFLLDGILNRTDSQDETQTHG